MNAKHTTLLNIDFDFMRHHTAHWIGLGFGSGLSPIAPGTAGTLFAWLTFGFLDAHLVSDAHWAVFLLLSFGVGVWASFVTAIHLKTPDPSAVVWDEIVAFWLVLWLIGPSDGWAQLGAFVLFRFFDAVKLGPVAWADAKFKGWGWIGGFGIMFDDVVAAGCALFVFACFVAF